MDELKESVSELSNRMDSLQKAYEERLAEQSLRYVLLLVTMVAS